jgi:hypothetical protein
VVKAIATFIAPAVAALFLGAGEAVDCATPSDCPNSDKPGCNAMCVDFGALGHKCLVICPHQRG